MRPVKKGIFFTPNDFFDYSRYFPQQFKPCLIGHAQLEVYSSSLHSFVIANSGTGQIGIRENQLFAAETPNPGGLNPDIFYCAHIITDNNVIADFKRPVKKYGKITEKVAQYRLCRQGHRHSADPQTGK